MTGLNDFRNHPKPEKPRCKCAHHFEDHVDGKCRFAPEYCGCKKYVSDETTNSEYSTYLAKKWEKVLNPSGVTQMAIIIESQQRQPKDG